jgi:alkanesulfonate monooxygenase SsuD/methylene tetrahydromethanopterin reductase-like flavin-dependent oxidoreductase (luciferase family)
MKFGVFDHLDRGSLPLDEFYEARLSLIEAYDRAGFYSYHLAEHHETPLGMAPSPSVFLAAAAQRTRHLRLGTLVYALPLHHPVRMIEEICMLDQLSRGRLDMGFGRGSSPIELEYHGVDPEDAPRAYEELLEIVLRGLTESELSHHGEKWHFDRVPMELAPYQRPYPPIWYGLHSVESAAKAARRGFNIVCNEPAEAAARYIARFREVWQELRGAAPEPHIGTTQFVVIAEDEDEARTIARRAYLRWLDSFHLLWRRHGRATRLSGNEPDFDALNAVGKGIAGTPAQVAAFLDKRLRTAGANYCINRFAFGDMTQAESARSVALFARHVAPVLRQRGTAAGLWRLAPR